MKCDLKNLRKAGILNFGDKFPDKIHNRLWVKSPAYRHLMVELEGIKHLIPVTAATLAEWTHPTRIPERVEVVRT